MLSMDFEATKPACTGKLCARGDNASGDFGLLETRISIVQLPPGSLRLLRACQSKPCRDSCRRCELG